MRRAPGRRRAVTGPPRTAADGSAGCAPPLRADARRNRELILAAADAAFAEEGLGVPVDEIARRAGVGAGTLYRHFPTKEALFEAVLVAHMDRLACYGQELAGSDQPDQALFEFVGRLASEAASKRNLVDALSGAGYDIKATSSESKAALEEVFQPFSPGPGGGPGARRRASGRSDGPGHGRLRPGDPRTHRVLAGTDAGGCLCRAEGRARRVDTDLGARIGVGLERTQGNDSSACVTAYSRLRSPSGLRTRRVVTTTARGQSASAPTAARSASPRTPP